MGRGPRRPRGWRRGRLRRSRGPTPRTTVGVDVVAGPPEGPSARRRPAAVSVSAIRTRLRGSAAFRRKPAASPVPVSRRPSPGDRPGAGRAHARDGPVADDRLHPSLARRPEAVARREHHELAGVGAGDHGVRPHRRKVAPAASAGGNHAAGAIDPVDFPWPAVHGHAPAEAERRDRRAAPQGQDQPGAAVDRLAEQLPVERECADRVARRLEDGRR